MTRTALLCSIAVLTLGAGLASAQPKPKSQKEVAVLQKMLGNGDPDTKIAAAEDLLNNYADSDFKPYALLAEADAYEAKGDYAKTIVFGERTLEADPKQFQAMLILARQYVTHVRDNDLDREEKLTKGEKYAKDAVAALQAAAKPNPAMSDDQWATVKKQATAEADAALATASSSRKKYAEAEEYYKQSIDLSGMPMPALNVRLAAVYNKDGKYDLALAELDKVKAMPNVPPAVTQVADQERAKATQGKSGAGATKPAPPPAPKP
jgi:tetratricopeptide (TPR) repeat protein